MVSNRQFKVEFDNQKTLLICRCCNRPFAVIEDAKMSIVSKHKNETHENVLDLAHLGMITAELRRQSQKSEVW